MSLPVKTTGLRLGTKSGQGQETRPLPNVIGVLLLFVLFWSIMAWGKQVMHQGRIETMTVEEGLLEVTSLVDGYLFLEEMVLHAPIEGIFVPLVQEGERVSVGTRVAEVVHISNMAQVQAELEQVQGELDRIAREGDQEIGQLQGKVQGQTGRVLEYLLALKGNLEEGRVLEAESAAQELEIVVAKRQEILEELARERRSLLQAQEGVLEEQEELQQFREGALAPVESPGAGVVSFHCRGDEQFFSLAQAMEVDPDYLESQVIVAGQGVKPGDQVRAGEPVVRVIDNFRIYLVIPLSKEQAQLLEGRNRVSFRVSQEERTRSGTLLKVTGGGGARLAVVELRDLEDELLISERKLPVEIILRQYRGVVVPTTALLEKDGKDGLLMVRGGEAVFRPVEVVGIYEEKAVVEGISLYQEIITNPRWVQENQRVW